ncbi:DUF2339 domain-containing protein [Hymenobacter aquaticus]|uniref:DUF2339 domain-containing protein n=1 Tax=Hymenobacter aquaticus TaxID=1867101 RepID=A0A4Z0QAH9_9BACT|nr:DUF2339 domain-containing protein [Hymenobacter aquaticus]TGE25722.1 DUF2339 domain-containing protein [Hymenobacter aquaticus]
MDTWVVLLVTVVLGLIYHSFKDRLKGLEQRTQRREEEHNDLLRLVEELREEVRQLRTAPPTPPVAAAPPAPTVRPAPIVTAPVAAAPAPPVVASAAAPVAPAAPAPPPPPVVPPIAAPVAPTPPRPVVVPAPVPASTPPAAVPAPPVVRPTPQPQPEPVFIAPPAPPRLVVPPPPPVPAEPTWWDRTEQVLLDNWTGILGAVVLVIGVGFLGIYTALQVTPPVRFAMICGFAAALLALDYFLRTKPFAERLHVWLHSSAAAIFLFACVGASSVPGLQWAAPPLSYLLLLAGVAANLWLAWRSSRESVATLHGVLSLVALAVIAPDLLTLGTAAAVTAFCIAITYRQRWKYQLLLSIVSFFVFHQYWHFHLAAPLAGGARLVAMALVMLVGVAAAVVQYRSVYARTQFDALLFAAHVLNWTTLGFNLYQYSTGSPWKTIPLALGSALTFFVARRARQLGIQWLFQTDTIISLILALATAFSLLGWHASGTVVGLFMLLESLLIAFIMARERETLVFQVASAGALLAGAGLLLLVLTQLTSYSPAELHRNTLLVLLAASAGAVYFRFAYAQPLLAAEDASTATNRALHHGFGGLVGALYLGVAALLLRALFGVSAPPAGLLVSGAAAAAGAVFGLAWWLRGGLGWFRTLHLAAGQVLLTVAILGLHKLGLGWTATATILYLETLLLAGLLGRATEVAAFRLVVGGALAAGLWLLLAGGLPGPHLPPQLLPRHAALLVLGGLGSTIFFHLLSRQLWLGAQRPTSPDRSLHQGVGALAGVLYLGGTAVALRALFGPSYPPVALLIGGLVVTAALLFGLSYWLRGGAEWFRILHLLLGQVVLAGAVLGLHEAGLSWPLTVVLLYLEMLLMTLTLARRREWWVYRVQLYATLLLATSLPVLVYGLGHLSAEQRALLLTLAALATVAAQIVVGRLAAPAYDALPFSYDPTYRLRLLGAMPGLLLLAAAGLIYEHTWAAWAAVGIGGGLLLLRRYVAVPGLWTGVVLAATGYHVLQWYYLLLAGAPLGTGQVLAYSLPLVLLSAMGLAYSSWDARQRQVRWPWLYLLGLHLTVVAWTAAAPHSEAIAVLLWLVLVAVAAGAAQWVRRRFTTPEALAAQGCPDRFLLHVMYAGLALALFWHFSHLVWSSEILWRLPARRLTAAALVLVLAGLAGRTAPTAPPLYRSWQLLHPYLPELTLALLGFTLWWEVQLTWQALLWLGLAFALTLGTTRLPVHLRRLQLYGVLFFWLSTVWVCYVALTRLAPGQLLSVPWLTSAGAVALQFAYAAVALRNLAAPEPVYWPPGLGGLAALGRLSPRQRVAALLYPAFVALTVLLVQSFDRLVLTVLLMLEVVALFITSLLLRRQDFRYASLVGVAICLVRLVFFDLSQRGTITRAVVFILMGMLLLGMNALYARFKDRFTPIPDADADPAAGGAPDTDGELPTVAPQE